MVILSTLLPNKSAWFICCATRYCSELRLPWRSAAFCISSLVSKYSRATATQELIHRQKKSPRLAMFCFKIPTGRARHKMTLFVFRAQERAEEARVALVVGMPPCAGFGPHLTGP